MKQDHEFLDVRDFHRKFKQLVSETPTMLTVRKAEERYDFMEEELHEFYHAAQNHDMAGMADALIDLVYVAKGTAVMMGLPWDALWADVQRANMAKVIGTTHRGNKVDVTKPPGWLAPEGAGILQDHGYRPDLFQTNGAWDEAKCLDDEVNR